MADLTHSLVSRATAYARFDFVERTLAHVTAADEHMALVHRLQAEGAIGARPGSVLAG
jgi:hypothetical protein